MSSNVTIVTYETADANCPAAYRCTARAFFEGKPMPVTFYDTTVEAARDRATTWWNERLEDERRRAEGFEKRKVALATARAQRREV